jgi:hypothetical protein
LGIGLTKQEDFDNKIDNPSTPLSKNAEAIKTLNEITFVNRISIYDLAKYVKTIVIDGRSQFDGNSQVGTMMFELIDGAFTNVIYHTTPDTRTLYLPLPNERVFTLVQVSYDPELNVNGEMVIRLKPRRFQLSSNNQITETSTESTTIFSPYEARYTTIISNPNFRLNKTNDNNCILSYRGKYGTELKISIVTLNDLSSGTPEVLNEKSVYTGSAEASSSLYHVAPIRDDMFLTVWKWFYSNEYKVVGRVINTNGDDLSGIIEFSNTCESDLSTLSVIQSLEVFYPILTTTEDEINNEKKLLLVWIGKTEDLRENYSGVFLAYINHSNKLFYSITFIINYIILTLTFIYLLF